MKIAIASEGDKEDSQVSTVSGRAPYYLIFEDENLVEAVKNPFAMGGGGAGFGTAQMLANKGVEVVVSGKFGPNMSSSLQSKGVKAIEMQGLTAKEAVKKVLNA